MLLIFLNHLHCSVCKNILHWIWRQKQKSAFFVFLCFWSFELVMRQTKIMIFLVSVFGSFWAVTAKIMIFIIFVLICFPLCSEREQKLQISKILLIIVMLVIKNVLDLICYFLWDFDLNKNYEFHNFCSCWNLFVLTKIMNFIIFVADFFEPSPLFCL